MKQAINIVWDTDGEAVDLPTSVAFPDSIQFPDGDSEQASNYLSDIFGWCVISFDVRSC